jgi:Ni/Fe-hydrogenase subunit HybB-like protein
MVRLGVLAGMLGYMFAASYLLIDLGRPWRLYYPMAISIGPSSVLFIVAWHVSLYVNVQLLEFVPTALEWLGSKRVHRWAVKATVGLVVLGTILTTIHQSALGAMYLITPGKLHPLWYSPNIPVLFFISAMFAAPAFLVAMGWFFSRKFTERCSAEFLSSLDANTFRLGRVMLWAMYVYFALVMIGVAQDNNWALLPTGYGQWFLVEIAGFVLAPALLLTYGLKYASVAAIRVASVWAIAGILLNRVNVNLIAYNWHLPDHLHHIVPPTTELIMIAAMVTLHYMTMRWIINRMPVLSEDPAYRDSH